LLNHNAITQLAPILDDPWIDHCDHIQVEGNPLDQFTLEETIPMVCEIPLSIQGDGFDICEQCLGHG